MRAQWVCSRERRIALYKRSSINQSMKQHGYDYHTAVNDNVVWVCGSRNRRNFADVRGMDLPRGLTNRNTVSTTCQLQCTYSASSQSSCSVWLLSNFRNTTRTLLVHTGLSWCFHNPGSELCDMGYTGYLTCLCDLQFCMRIQINSGSCCLMSPGAKEHIRDNL